MIVLTTKVSPAPELRPESPMEKTTREVRQRLDDEAAKRQAKVARLRKARLALEASADAEVTVSKAKPTRKKPTAKPKP
jgi:hypothetical protein